jgi:hypothetical protein
MQETLACVSSVATHLLGRRQSWLLALIELTERPIAPQSVSVHLAQ